MSETELELFDLLKKEKLNKKEEKQIKLASKKLLEILFDAKNQILIQEWHKERASQEVLRQEIKKILGHDLLESYDRVIFSEKTDLVFRHFYELAEMGLGFAA